MKLLVALVYTIIVVAGKTVDPNIELPSSLKICRLEDPNRDECIKNSIQKFLPTLRDGIENIGIQSMDPFIYEKLSFNIQNNNLLMGKVDVKDVLNYGFSSGVIQSLESNITDEEMSINGKVFFPKMFVSGKYESNVAFNAFRFVSRGQYNVTMKDITAKWNIKSKLVDVNGEAHMKAHYFEIIPEVGSMKFSISGLFPDKSLNQVFSDFFTENWKIFYDEALPDIRNQWEPLVLDISNKIFSNFPFKKLLLKD
ncbi:CLUMA_CG014221, isoform A [Clunio marinus]|uniref:CLUMA_CG014221, isoform A n=1 Tax=Clunio marinus TaxID=568069 RepID=A0A1J1IMI6_9DIPT|nr:CLUMA_CG014221, isoform A [Clunio marinus]